MASVQAVASDRMRRAVLTFQVAAEFLDRAHRRCASRTKAEVDAYWAGPGKQVEEDIRVASTEVVEAVKTLTDAGMVVGVLDRQPVLAARRHLAKGPSS